MQNWVNVTRVMSIFRPCWAPRNRGLLVYGHAHSLGGFVKRAPMDEGRGRKRKGSYIEERGPTYAARSLPQYNSAFATRVLQSTCVCVKGERACVRIFKLFRTPGINSTQDWDFFGFDFEICIISLLVLSKYSDFTNKIFWSVLGEIWFFRLKLSLRLSGIEFSLVWD